MTIRLPSTEGNWKRALKAQSVAAAGSANGDAIDTAGAEFVEFYCTAEQDVATSVTFKIQEDAASGGSYTDITGATKTILTADEAKIAIIRVNVKQSARLQYMRVVYSVTGGTASVGAAMVYIHSMGTVPKTQDYTVVAV